MKEDEPDHTNRIAFLPAQIYLARNPAVSARKPLQGFYRRLSQSEGRVVFNITDVPLCGLEQ
jgi:hypothetical protein